MFVAAAKLNLRVVVSEMFQENCYVAWLDGRRECLIFDPGFDPAAVIAVIEENGLTPAAIVNTHGHSDHIAGNEAVKDRWPDCPIVIGEHEADKLTDPMLNLSGLYGFALLSPPADQLVRHGEVFCSAGIELEVRETPGHSRGHVVFLWKGQTPWLVFGGDVLFQGSVGRTDFPDGSFRQLEASIRNQLYTLPDDTQVLPGHGPPTTIGAERRSNPFVQG